MGLSFHDKPSLVEAIGSLRFAANDPNPTTGSISEDGSLRIGPDDLNAMPEVEMIRMEEEGRNDDVEGSDDIQLVLR
jgi:hypothetical protein